MHYAIIMSAYILLNILLKYLHKATNANSLFLMVNMTIELKHQTQVFFQNFFRRISNSDKAENILLFDGKKILIYLNRKVNNF